MIPHRYTPEELERLYQLVADAAAEDPGEDNEEERPCPRCSELTLGSWFDRKHWPLCAGCLVGFLNKEETP